LSGEIPTLLLEERMLRMDQVHVVRHKVLVEGRAISAVAREMEMSRNTIRKYLSLSEPKRVVRRPKASPKTELVAPRIDELLEKWRGRTTPKQRVTGTRIHRQLVEEGYEVGTTTVRDYLREKRREKAEVFIPLIHRPGDEAQVDFFEVTVEEDGEFRKTQKFVMRLMYSGRDFVRLYDRADQLSFLHAHVRAFEYLGGVPHRVVHDNLSAAVKKTIGSERRLTERFMALCSHYLFEPCFARPGEGHDKGGVEARGKGIRLRHLTPIPRGKTLAEISEIVMAEVEMAFTGEQRFAQERGLSRKLPENPFEARKVELVSISSGAAIRVDGATYSVPSRWASRPPARRAGGAAERTGRRPRSPLSSPTAGDPCTSPARPQLARGTVSRSSRLARAAGPAREGAHQGGLRSLRREGSRSEPQAGAGSGDGQPFLAQRPEGKRADRVQRMRASVPAAIFAGSQSHRGSLLEGKRNLAQGQGKDS